MRQVVHCNQSYHRGLVLCAALLQRLAGAPVHNFLQWLGRHRDIWDGHTDHSFVPSERRDEQLLDAVQWAVIRINTRKENTHVPRRLQCM